VLKLFILGRRAPGRTRAAAHAHLRDGHGRMVVLPPADCGPMPSDYVQNHVVDGAYAAHGPHAVERDLLTELWFDDIAHMQASTATRYYREHLRPDEPRFVDDAGVARMLCDARVVHDGAHGGARGRFKLVRLMTLTPGAVLDEAAVVAQMVAAGFTRIVVNGVRPGPTGAKFVDVMVEAWTDTLETARTAADEIALPDGADPAASLTLVTEEYPRARLIALLT
jgi:vanillate O-demethylase ferredoxin subunit